MPAIDLQFENNKDEPDEIATSSNQNGWSLNQAVSQSLSYTRIA